MPYCHKCGAKLDDDARFCPVCGTPVAQVGAVKQATPQPAPRQTPRAAFPLVAIVLVVILVIAVVGVVIGFAPFQQVNFTQSNEASAGNVNSLRLVLSAEIANVNVMLKDLPGNQRAAINISATGRRGIFGGDEPLALAFGEDTNNSTLTYSIGIRRAEDWPTLNMLDVVCNVYVDPSVSLDIIVRTTTGTITMNADEEVTFEGLTLETTTGNVQFSWEEAKIARNIPLNLKATTGSVDVNITQSRQLAFDVTLNAEATTGGVSLVLNIKNDVGARISATTTLGGVDIQQQGFSGNQAPLESDNYPAGSNFIVNLSATLGGIDINASYELGGTRS